MKSSSITPFILTFNEAVNIRRTLSKLKWADQVLVIDSFSEDDTIKICSEFENVTVLQRTFVSFADQCNFALTQITTAWSLSLDADYELSAKLESELATMVLDDKFTGYKARFVYRIFGRPLMGSLYPPRTVLYRTDHARYRNEGHGHRVEVTGPIGKLNSVIFHDDRKPLSRWLKTQLKYAEKEAIHLLTADPKALSTADKLRLMGWPAPMLAGLYVLFAKGCILDGPAGWYYTLQRVLAEIFLALEILDRKLRNPKNKRKSDAYPRN